jgi:hypothetical protein
MDPDPYPALFVSDFLDANKKSRVFLLFLLDDGKIRILSCNSDKRNRILEAQHCLETYFSLNIGSTLINRKERCIKNALDHTYEYMAVNYRFFMARNWF